MDKPHGYTAHEGARDALGSPFVVVVDRLDWLCHPQPACHVPAADKCPEFKGFSHRAMVRLSESRNGRSEIGTIHAAFLVVALIMRTSVPTSITRPTRPSAKIVDAATPPSSRNSVPSGLSTASIPPITASVPMPIVSPSPSPHTTP